jgi:uncharacterized protein (TIGR00255 family)
MRSMTGFGRSSSKTGEHVLSVEAKSVNHKGLNISVSLPDALSRLEPDTRDRIKSRFHRGRIRIEARLERAEGGGRGLNLNSDAAWSYLAAAEKLKIEHGAQGDISVSEFLRLPGVMQFSGTDDIDEEEMSSVYSECLMKALDELMTAREREGADLMECFREGLDSIGELARPLLDAQRNSVAERFQRLRERVMTLVSDVSLDNDRMLQELALLTEKSDITEEIQRLMSHMEHALETIELTDIPSGRRLEFILQEMHRELNTMGSKVADSDLAVDVIEMKNTLASLREQAANVE